MFGWAAGCETPGGLRNLPTGDGALPDSECRIAADLRQPCGVVRADTVGQTPGTRQGRRLAVLECRGAPGRRRHVLARRDDLGLGGRLRGRQRSAFGDHSGRGRPSHRGRGGSAGQRRVHGDRLGGEQGRMYRAPKRQRARHRPVAALAARAPRRRQAALGRGRARRSGLRRRPPPAAASAPLQAPLAPGRSAGPTAEDRPPARLRRQVLASGPGLNLPARPPERPALRPGPRDRARPARVRRPAAAHPVRQRPRACQARGWKPEARSSQPTTMRFQTPGPPVPPQARKQSPHRKSGWRAEPARPLSADWQAEEQRGRLPRRAWGWSPEALSPQPAPRDSGPGATGAAAGAAAEPAPAIRVVGRRWLGRRRRVLRHGRGGRHGRVGRYGRVGRRRCGGRL